MCGGGSVERKIEVFMGLTFVMVRQLTQISEKISSEFKRGNADPLYSQPGTRQHLAALLGQFYPPLKKD